MKPGQIIRSLIFCSLLLVCFIVGRATELPGKPILRIEPGTHIAAIRGIDADRTGRWLVSVSDDKTVRVWDADTGLLERVLRPPIGEGPEWQLHDVAISPDGRLVACGEGMHQGLGQLSSIYLFRRVDGHVLSRFQGLPGAITHLAFSPDGRVLEAGLDGKSGIRLFAVTQSANAVSSGSPSMRLALIAQDSNYDKGSAGADFSPDGRWLVTSSFDNNLRLYDLTTLGGNSAESISLSPRVTKASPAGGSLPKSVKFSPDGSKVAVGFLYPNPTMVSVLSARDLRLLYNADNKDISWPRNNYLTQVAWSSDSRSLFAAGAYESQHGDQAAVNRFVVRRWTDGGRGAPVDLWQGASSVITGLASLPNGSLAIAAADPIIAALKPDGSQKWAIDSSAARFCTPLLSRCPKESELQLSSDGRTVKFAYGPDGVTPALFSLTDRTLSLAPVAIASSLSPPQTNAPGLDLVWDPNYPTLDRLNGQPLTKEGEFVNSLAIAWDQKSLLFGTGTHLHRCDRSGKEIWSVMTPATTTTINITGNGRVAVVAFGDGTVRWYSYSDGRELVAFFPHADRKRWVLWTPSGYYDASPGGEELIGWHVNNGPDKEADFFPASRFRSVKYRPDVISKVLDTLDESEAVRLADAERGKASEKANVAEVLPPVVTITSPEDGSKISATAITLHYTARAPSGEPVTGIRVLVDGRPVAENRGIKPAANEGEQTLTFTVPARDCEVSLIATNRFSASVPATVHLIWDSTEQSVEFVAKPKLYVLAVGESAYQKPELTLGYAAKDAKDFAAAMQAQNGGLYRDVEIKLLTDAPKDDIEDGLDWLRRQVTSRDVGIIFLAGHGVDDPNGIYYFLPANADPERIMRTGLVFSDLKNTVQSIAGKAVMFVDTCHSGNVMGARRGIADINAVVNELASAENGVVVFAASTGRQYSLEDPQWQNGAFTKALVEGISGKADYSGKGKITINMLDLYLSERVKELTKGQQTPATTKPSTVPDFPLAVKQ